jgi:type VI protein secretion system component Hcp
MKKKSGKARAKSPRPAARDLTARKGGGVKGGDVRHSEFSIVKLVDKASPKLYEN